MKNSKINHTNTSKEEDWLLDWQPTDEEMSASEKAADPYYFEEEEDE